MKKKIFTAGLYLVFIVLMLFVLSRKQNFMEDELLTYNLANGKGWLAPENGQKYVPAEAPFIEYLTTDGHINIERVWTRQRLDVHPPVYYLLVHLICCVFPNSISIRYAGIVNVIFQLLTLFIIRKLVDRFETDNKIKTIISLTYVLSAGILSISSFLRMYVMLGFWIALITYIHVSNLRDYKIKTCLCIFAVTVLGALTHYHYILFVFFLSLIAGIYALIEKRIKDAIKLVVTMVASGVASYLIFPAMINHMFFEYRGEEAINNLKNGSFFERIADYYDVLSGEMFGGFLVVFICIILFAVILNFVSDNKLTDISKEEVRKFLYILIPAVCFFMFVSKTTPNVSVRYMYPIYPIILVGIMILTYKVFVVYIAKEKTRLALFGILMAVCVVSGYFRCNWDWLYLDSVPYVELAESEGLDTDAYCFYTGSWRILPSYLEIVKFRSSTFYDIDSDFDINTAFRWEDRKVCVFCIGLDDEQKQMVRNAMAENHFTVINEQQFRYSDTYYAFR